MVAQLRGVKFTEGSTIVNNQRLLYPDEYETAGRALQDIVVWLGFTNALPNSFSRVQEITYLSALENEREKIFLRVTSLTMSKKGEKNMTVKLLNILKSPPLPPHRAGKRYAMHLPEFEEVMEHLRKGIASQEYIVVELSPESLAMGGYDKNNNAMGPTKFAVGIRAKTKALHIPVDVYERNGKVFIIGK